MQRRYNPAHLILVLVLIPLMITVAAQAQITFMSNRDGHVHPRFGWPAFEVYVMDTDGGNPQNLTNDPNDDRHPSWSPDGKQIVFSSDRDGNGEIYVMEVDGNNQRRLTNNPNLDKFPSWSPDGERIAFMSQRDGHFIGDFGLSYEIYVMDADGKNTRRLTNNRKTDVSPSWSPDGKWIVFSADRKGDDVNHEIYVMDADGGHTRRLTNNRVDDTSPSWSPDGKRIIFTSQRDGHVHPILGWPTSEIYVMDADGKNTRRLTNNPHSDSNPEWVNSPFSVSLAGKKFTIWGRLKQVD